MLVGRLLFLPNTSAPDMFKFYICQAIQHSNVVVRFETNILDYIHKLRRYVQEVDIWRK